MYSPTPEMCAWSAYPIKVRDRSGGEGGDDEDDEEFEEEPDIEVEEDPRLKCPLWGWHPQTNTLFSVMTSDVNLEFPHFEQTLALESWELASIMQVATDHYPMRCKVFSRTVWLNTTRDKSCVFCFCVIAHVVDAFDVHKSESGINESVNQVNKTINCFLFY